MYRTLNNQDCVVGQRVYAFFTKELLDLQCKEASAFTGTIVNVEEQSLEIAIPKKSRNKASGLWLCNRLNDYGEHGADMNIGFLTVKAKDKEKSKKKITWVPLTTDNFNQKSAILVRGNARRGSRTPLYIFTHSSIKKDDGTLCLIGDGVSIQGHQAISKIFIDVKDDLTIASQRYTTGLLIDKRSIKKTRRALCHKCHKKGAPNPYSYCRECNLIPF